MNNVARTIAGISVGFGLGLAAQFGAGAAGYQGPGAAGAIQLAGSSLHQSAGSQTAAPQPGRGLGGFTEPAPLNF